jgi:hypothetical protein
MFYKCRFDLRQTGMIFEENTLALPFCGISAGKLLSFRLARTIHFDPQEFANWLQKAQQVPYRPEEGDQLRRSA